MMKTSLWLSVCLISFSALAQRQVRQWSPSALALKDDLRLIQQKAGWASHPLEFSLAAGAANRVSVLCEGERVHLKVEAQEEEQTATLYHGVFKLGFLFPHPRWQVSPTLEEARAHCGESFEWRPAFAHRGFHLHTLHPNEWVKGFLQGDEAIATDTVRWMARNRQNVLDLSLLRKDWKKAKASLKAPFALAKELGVSRGVSLGAVLQQQNSLKLIPLLSAITGRGDETHLVKNIRKLGREVDYDFMTMESGTSEFTSVSYPRTISWFNTAAAELKKEGKRLFTKVHVSTNQSDERWGNYNFLPRYASSEVGVMPHTVMFYGLWDKKVPMYGNDTFSHMLQFIREEKDKRDVWYYPETSYWIGMDQDIPLFLTDYLTSRAEDMQRLHPEGIHGHFNFTTGHEAGYWLFDWTIALNSDLDENFDPLSGLRLLGEDAQAWRAILDYQTKFFKEEQLIALISTANIQDELTSKHRIHERHILKEVLRSPPLREAEILKLERALALAPSLAAVKHPELKLMLQVTEHRLRHVLSIRKALRHPKGSQARENELALARGEREAALRLMDNLKRDFNRYPSARVFERNKNPTSYQFGYLWPAATLHFWRREEEQVRGERFSPFFLNIYNVLDIIF